MNVMKRAFLSMTRKSGQSSIIFLLVLLLSVFLSVGMSTRYATYQTEMNLRTRLPAIATLRSADFYQPTLEMIEAVGALPYVLDYDFKSWTYLFSEELEWIRPEVDSTLIPEGMTLEDIVAFQGGHRHNGGLVNQFPVVGVNQPYLTDVQSELISLSSGRFMTEAEIDAGADVAIISRGFAELNHLEIGSTLYLENNLIDGEAISEYAPVIGGIQFSFHYWHRDEFKIAHQPIELEVIGIFEVQRGFLYPDDPIRTHGETIFASQLHNQIYIPRQRQMEMARYLMHYDPTYFFSDATEDQPLRLEPLFLLHDPRDINNFTQAASEILPENWNIYDTSAAFAPFISSMDTILWISDLVSIGAIIATVTILSLLFTLLIHERRYEIGIYRTLGESRKKVMIQLLIEVATLSVVAMMLALFIGNHLSNTISRDMLEREFIRQEQEDSSGFADHIPFELFLFTPEPVSIEEMVNTYNVSLNVSNTAFFFAFQLGSVLFSTIISIIYLVRLDPKKLLL